MREYGILGVSEEGNNAAHGQRKMSYTIKFIAYLFSDKRFFLFNSNVN